MNAIDIAAIERRARQLRAQEMQRLENLFAERARLYALLLAGSLLSLLETASELLRPLFAWNPQAEAMPARAPSLLLRLRQGAHAAFAWKPRRSHSF